MEKDTNKGFLQKYPHYIGILIVAGMIRIFNIPSPFSPRSYSGTLGNNGADEGIFLMSARLLSNGYRMYVDVNTQQGPLFTFLLDILNGDPINTRLLTIAISLIGVIGIIAISEITGNKRIGIISSLFLAANYIFFKESRHVSSDLYCAVFLILGFYTLFLYYRGLDGEGDMQEDRRLLDPKVIFPLLITGILFSMAAMSKLFAAIPIISVGVYMLVGSIRGSIGIHDKKVRIEHIIILVVSTVIPSLLLMSIYGFENTLNGMFLDNLNRPSMPIDEKLFTLLKFLAFSSVPFVLAMISVVKEIQLRSVKLMLVWSVPLFVYLLIQSPLWEHYFIILLPPVCYLGGRGFNYLFQDRKDMDDLHESEEIRVPQKIWYKKLKPGSLPLISLGILFIFVSMGVEGGILLDTGEAIEWGIARDVSDAIEKDEFMISGDPIIGVYADRLQPPEATNLAEVRHPPLDDLELINITCDYDVQLVIFTYHLSKYDLYVKFIKENFDFKRAYQKHWTISDIEGRIPMGERTFNMYIQKENVNLQIAKEQFLSEHQT